MDLALDILDPLFFDYIYRSAHQVLGIQICPLIQHNSHGVIDGLAAQFCKVAADSNLWERESTFRQTISIFLLIWPISASFYLLFGTICYNRNFDRSLRSHPKFQKGQVRAEISESLWALFWLCVWTVPIFVAQVRGCSKLYKFGSATWPYEIAQYAFFVIFSDTCMYWLHRMFHCPFLFKTMHKRHHRFVIPTPFSAYAFHPLEAYIMSLPIYVYSFIWPMSDIAQLVVFFWTNIWTFLLHDNRDQFHTVHHKNIQYNFGQYLHLWDILGGTYQDPSVFLWPEKTWKDKQFSF